jgi:hypothetical protein
MYEGPRKPTTGPNVLGYKDIPKKVTDQMNEHSVVEIFPFSRSQNLPETVSMVKFRSAHKFRDKNMDKIART